MASILIVDDEPQVSGLLSAMLVRAGHKVQTATTPQAAIEMCSPPACFDVVLSEVNLPVMDGHELARWIASRCPGTRTVLTSDSPLACADCPYAAHCAFLRKPFDPEEVLATVASAIAIPAPLKCVIAQLLSANYSAALNDFYGIGAISRELHTGEPGYDADLKKKGDAYVALLTARAEYRSHVSQHGCRQPQMAVAAFQEIKHRLRHELLEARAVFEDASQKLQRLTLLLPDLEAASEAEHVMEQTKRVHHAAHQVYMMALQRFSDFLRDEIFRVERGQKPS